MSGTMVEPVCGVRVVATATDVWWTARAENGGRLLMVATYMPPAEPGVLLERVAVEEAKRLLQEMVQRAADPPYSETFVMQG